MQNNSYDYYPGKDELENGELPAVSPAARKGRCSFGVLTIVVCIVAAVSVLITYTATAASKRAYYTQELQKQQEMIGYLQQVLGQQQQTPEGFDGDFEQLQLLSLLFENYAYYAGEVSEEEILVSILKAYARATGDLYAEYYTDEEYAALTAENVGDYEGIGVSVVQTTLNVNAVEYQVFQVISIYENSPAAGSGLRIGDMIYAVVADGEYKTVNELGYTTAISHIKGAKGTTAVFSAFRPTGTDYETIEFQIVRDSYETQSVSWFVSEDDATVGVVRIAQFDLTAPTQLKKAVSSLQARGVTRFVFDVRNNPGGDLQSIKAVMSYFLNDGDLILSAIDRNGNPAKSYLAQSTELSGIYASCSVAPEEVGMYHDLDMVVLCNGNTASAAEVFVATLRDYALATVVGETTYGKGVMQSYLPLSSFGDYSGYFKMTTYAYVTACGITYHDIGVSPAEGYEVALSEEAMQYHFYLLPQALDNQLAMAIAALN